MLGSSAVKHFAVDTHSLVYSGVFKVNDTVCSAKPVAMNMRFDADCSDLFYGSQRPLYEISCEYQESILNSIGGLSPESLRYTKVYGTKCLPYASHVSQECSSDVRTKALQTAIFVYFVSPL